MPAAMTVLGLGFWLVGCLLCLDRSGILTGSLWAYPRRRLPMLLLMRTAMGESCSHLWTHESILNPFARDRKQQNIKTHTLCIGLPITLYTHVSIYYWLCFILARHWIYIDLVCGD